MIEIRHISKTYDTQKAIDDLSLIIRKGTVFGFLGPNGAGKTTAMKMIIGINKPDDGTIEIDGEAPETPSVRERTGFKPEEPHFYDYLTGFEFLQFANHLFNKKHWKSQEEYDHILKKVGLFEAKDKIIKNYSKGMKQRLGFAQAVVSDPDHIFLDEPLEGLDPIGRRDLKVIIKELKEREKTVFLNSHILSDIEALCDDIGVIHKGKLVYAGPVSEFCRGKTLEEQFIAAIERLT